MNQFGWILNGCHYLCLQEPSIIIRSFIRSIPLLWRRIDLVKSPSPATKNRFQLVRLPNIAVPRSITSQSSSVVVACSWFYCVSCFFTWCKTVIKSSSPSAAEPEVLQRHVQEKKSKSSVSIPLTVLGPLGTSLYCCEIWSSVERQDQH